MPSLRRTVLEEQEREINRANEAAGYTLYEGQWLTVPQLVATILAAQAAP